MILEIEMAEDFVQPELTLAKMAADIVVAYVSRNVLGADELPRLTMQIRAALAGPADKPVEAVMVPARSDDARENHPHAIADQMVLVEEYAKLRARAQKPAVAISKSVTHDHVVCLEDGKKFRSLKRHLRSEHGMTAEQYREKWNLPQHYELVAPGYSAVRTKLAKQHGLGRAPRGSRDDLAPKIAAE